MKTYYVIEGSLSFGFCGFIKKACLSEDEANKVMSDIKRKYKNLTNCKIKIVQAKNKKEAESNCKSMFCGDLAGIDKVNI